MSFTSVNATGLALGSSGSQQVKLASSAANVLNLQGTASNVLAKLRGLDQPSDDTDATSRSYVQNYVQSSLRGLQTKLAVRLASLVPINLSSGVLEQSATVLRWSYVSHNTDMLGVPDTAGRVIQPYSFLSSATNSWSVGFAWTPAANFTYDQWGDDMSLNFAFGPNYDDRRSSFRSVGPKSPAPDTRIYFYNTFTNKPTYYNQSDFPLGETIYFLSTYNGQTQTATSYIAKRVNGSLVLPTPLTNSNPTTRTVAEGFSVTTGDALVQMTPGYIDISDVVLANKILTLQETFGPAPQGWTTTGVDGVIPSANDRILLAAQSDGTQNGIYVVSSDGTTLERPPDFAVGSDARSAYVFANGSGVSNDNKGFLCTNNSAAIVDTDAQTWQVYTAAGGLGGLSVNGSTISTSSASVSFANPVAVGTTTVSPATIVDSSGTLTFSNTNIAAPAVSTAVLSAPSGSISLGSTNMTTSGDMQAGNFVSPSDERLKTDEEEAEILFVIDENPDYPEGRYQELLALQPKTFRWRADGRRDIGLIAQEVQALLQEYPEFSSLVRPVSDNSNVYLGIDYSKLSVPNLLLIKDLYRQFERSLGQADPETPADWNLPLWEAFKKLYLHVQTLQEVLAAVTAMVPWSPTPPDRGLSIVTGSDDLPPDTTGISGLEPWNEWP